MNTNSYFDGMAANKNPEEFISKVIELEKSGMKEIDIAKATGFETVDACWEAYDDACGKARSNRIRSVALAMLADGKSQAETARALGINESTLRSLLNERSQQTYTVREIANRLRELVDEKGMIDVGIGVELEYHATRTKFVQACKILSDEGYPTFWHTVALAFEPNKRTSLSVMCSPGTTLLLAGRALDIIQKDRI